MADRRRTQETANHRLGDTVAFQQFETPDNQFAEKQQNDGEGKRDKPLYLIAAHEIGLLSQLDNSVSVICLAGQVYNLQTTLVCCG